MIPEAGVFDEPIATAKSLVSVAVPVVKMTPTVDCIVLISNEIDLGLLPFTQLKLRLTTLEAAVPSKSRSLPE